jgi:hypothetical protein
MLNQERLLREEQAAKHQLEKEARQDQKRREQERLIEEAVKAAAVEGSKKARAEIEEKLKEAIVKQVVPSPGKKEGKSKAIIKARGEALSEEEDEEDNEDEGEFFIRKKGGVWSSSAGGGGNKLGIESFMSVSNQHKPRGFGSQAVSGKATRTSAFEDDDEADLSADYLKMLQSRIVKPVPVVPP